MSFIIPVFNTGPYLTDAVRSILDQKALPDTNLPVFEIILIDDGSTDPETLRILSSVSFLDSRIRVITNRRTKGAAGARNTGIKDSKSDWITFLDADDILFPTSLASRWNVLIDHPSARWIGAQFSLLRPISQLGSNEIFDKYEEIVTQSGVNSDGPTVIELIMPFEKLLDGCFLGIMTVLIRRQFLLDCGIFDEDLSRAEDYHLWFKCALQSEIHFLIRSVAHYRIHSKSLTHRSAPRFLHEEEMIWKLLNMPGAHAYRSGLLGRYDLVMQERCWFFRKQRCFGSAFKAACIWTNSRPLKLSAWKEILTATARRK